ncbi:MAG: hypothetical protein RIA62_06920 [Cyclobacteriaceae bacterium]
MMDIKAEKLSLIEWLAGVEDSRVIKQFIALQKSNQYFENSKLTEKERLAIDKGLQSIKDGKVESHSSVMESTRKKYPNLFK